MSDGSGVSRHLRIDLAEYDARIRTFVPFYEEMLAEAERVVDAEAPAGPTVVDLGIGTGALAERCRRVRPEASLVGIDADGGMLAIASRRLGGDGGVALVEGSFLDVDLPEADLVVACLALHHVSDPTAKRSLYARCRQAVGPRGRMVIADCYLPRATRLVDEGMAAWRRHLEASYPPEEAAGHLAAWAEEDTYFPLADELEWMRDVGFRPDVVWRRGLFAVVHAV